MEQNWDFFGQLDEGKSYPKGFFEMLDMLEREEKSSRGISFWAQLDELEENEKRLAEIYAKKRRTFIQEAEEMARQEKVVIILTRLHRINDFDVYRYYPGDVEKTKKKSRQKSMLTGILAMLYNFIAFGYKDPLVPVARKKMSSFIEVRKYYRKYTGPEEGPRFRKMYAERQKQIKLMEAQKAKADAKRDMLPRPNGTREDDKD